jgi:hypothetical protein
MTSGLHHIHKDNLEHLEEILIYRGSNPYTYDFVAHSGKIGLITGKMASMTGAEDLTKIVNRLDEAAGAARDSVNEFWEVVKGEAISNQVDVELFSYLYKGVPADTGDQGLDAFAVAIHDMVTRSMPSETIRLIRKTSFYNRPEDTYMDMRRFGQSSVILQSDESTIRHAAIPHEVLSYFTSGNMEARRQAAETFPLAISDLMKDETFCHKVDTRSELRPFVAQHLGLSASEMRVYMRFEAAFSSLGYAENNPAGTAAPLSIISRPGNVEDVQKGASEQTLFSNILFSIRTSPRNACQFVAEAAKRIRIDQLPKPGTEMNNIDVLSAIGAHLSSYSHAGSYGLGHAAYDRFLSRVKVGTWHETSKRLEKQFEKMSDIDDYLRFLGRCQFNMGVMSTIRETGCFDLEEISTAADRIIADLEVDNEAALKLSEFLNFVDYFKHRDTYRGSGIGELIGSAASLKTISEMSERWHHMVGNIENELMSSSENIEWEPLLPGGSVTLGDYVCREIHSSVDLIEQGRKEKHCVGSYSRDILNARVGSIKQIFSIENRNGDILSTAEIFGSCLEGEDVVAFSCLQHKAKRNTMPDAGAEAAVEDLCEHLRTLPVDAVKEYVAKINSDPKNLKIQLIETINAFGVNICNPDIPETILENIKDVLPKSLRDMSLDQWRENHNANHLIYGAGRPDGLGFLDFTKALVEEHVEKNNETEMTPSI